MGNLQVTNDVVQKTNKKETHLLVSCIDGYLFEYSIEQRKIVYEFQKLKKLIITSVVMHNNSKSFFVLTLNGGIHQYLLKNHSCIKKVFSKTINIMISWNSKYLITGKGVGNSLEIRTVRT